MILVDSHGRAGRWCRALLFALLALASARSCLGLDCPPAVEPVSKLGELKTLFPFYWEKGCRATVAELAEASIPELEKRHGPESLEVAEALYWLSWSRYWLKERGPEEIALAERSLSIRRQQGADPHLVAQSHVGVGALKAAFLANPEMGFDALSHFETARRIWSHDVAANRGHIADLSIWLAELIQDWPGGSRMIAERLEWYPRLHRPGSKERGLVLQGLAIAGLDENASDSRDLALLIALYGVGLSQSTQIGGAAHAGCLSMVGKIFDHRQAYDKSSRIFGMALAARRDVHPPGHPQIARGEHNLGEALMLIGDLDSAIPLLENAYSLRRSYATERYPNPGGTSLYLLGKARFFVGDYSAALQTFKDALPTIERSFGVGRYYVAIALSLADVQLALDRQDLAIERLERTLRALDERFTGGRGNASTARPASKLQRAAIESRLGDLWVRKGKAARGRALLLAAERAQSGPGGAPLDDLARTWRGLSLWADSVGNSASAADYLRRAITALSREGSEHPSLVDCWLDLVDLEWQRGRYRSSDEALVEVDRLLDSQWMDELAFGAQARRHLAWARSAERRGNRERALRSAILAGELFESHLRPVLQVSTPGTALRLSQSLGKHAVDLAVRSLAAASPEETRQVWELVVRRRGAVFQELSRRYRPVGSGADVENLRRRWQVAQDLLIKAQLDSLFSLSADDQSVMRLAASRRRSLNQVEIELAEALTRTGRAPIAASGKLQPAVVRQPSGLEVAVPALSPDHALVAFWQYSGRSETRRYGVFFAQGADRVEFVDLGPADPIDRKIEAWRGLLNGSPMLLQKLGVEIKTQVWHPILSRLDPALPKRIYLVTDGALNFLPPEALPGNQSGTFLIEDGIEFHRLASERELSAPGTSRLPSSHSLLALGGVRFNSSQRKMSSGAAKAETATRAACRSGRLSLERLGGTLGEVEDILHIFKSAVGPDAETALLTDAAATEGELKRLAGRYSILHVATHGFTSLDCSVTGRESVRSVDVPGLALAGANRLTAGEASVDDGILTLPEILALDLRKVDWVVLSACESGLGEVTSGEGVWGLGQAFRAAGAKTQIVSLWKVPDQSTREVMAALYRARFEDGMELPSALRAAQLEAIGKARSLGRTAHPRTWAGFVGMGSWH